MPLYVVATPIGNLQDITLRAIQVLREAEIIACEDTRRTRRLLQAHDIQPGRLISYHDHNEARRAEALADDLARGIAIALVTNAGTPLVSDPGYRLVAAAAAAGCAVIPIPGPSAAVAALSASGLPCHAFTFLGFPPRKPGKLRNFLRDAQGHGTMILYEAPQRIGRLLEAAVEVFGGESRGAICRELTKVHEEIVRGPLDSLLATYGPDGGKEVKGEVVVLIARE